MIFLLWPLIGILMFYITTIYLEGKLRPMAFWTEREFFVFHLLAGPITIFLFLEKLK